MSKKKEYMEIVYYKGNMNQDGAIFRLNEMHAILLAISMQHDCDFQEDDCSYALMAPTAAVEEPIEMTRRAKKEVLGYVDLCGYFSQAQIEKKAKALLDLATEKGITLGVGLVRSRMTAWSMEHTYSERRWLL